MVVRLFTPVLLLVLPSFVYGSTTTINVFNDSGSLELSSSPDNVTISGSLSVTVCIAGEVSVNNLPTDLPLKIEVADNLLTPKYKDNIELVRVKGVKGCRGFGDSVPVTFSSSSQVPLQQRPIPVTISTTLDGTPAVVKSQIIDNRGEHISYKLPQFVGGDRYK
jgi:hypothetical protein